MTTAIYKLTRNYGDFFSNCLDFAISPYTLTLSAFIEKPANIKPEELLLGIGACIFFSTVVPILPTIASITFALAAFAASIAIASMFITYPITIAVDMVKNASEERSAFSPF